MRKQRLSLGTSSAALALVAAFFAAPAAWADRSCSDIKYRLWQEHQVTWYDYGETVEIRTGEEGHLYLHVEGKGPTPYSAGADMGYPSGFGLGGDSHQVRRHVKMRAQDDRDRRAGRLQFTAEEPGTAYVGYNLVSVKVPGDIKSVAPRCRLDKVAIRVLPRDAGRQPQPPQDSRAAALEVTEMLYRSLLRRERHGGDPRSFVDQIDEQGKHGIEAVAEAMLVSQEFRHQALLRTQQQRTDRSRDLAELREWMLRDMYRDLYGLLEPSPREIDEDLADLDTCLSSDRRSEAACARLSHHLVSHRLFFERNQELLDELRPRRHRDRRPRDRYRRP